LKTDKNEKRLKKAYDKLCAVTCAKTKALTEEADMKTLKEAFSAVKEGINIGEMLSGDSAAVIRVLFEDSIDDCAV